MAIQWPVPLSEEEIRSMVDEGIVDPHVEESLRAMQSEVSRALQDGTQFPLIAQLDWVDYIKDTTVALAGKMEEDGDDLWHCAAAFAGRAGEEALVSELRSQAVWCDVWSTRTDALGVDAWCLRDRYMRVASGITVEHKDIDEVLRTATSEFMALVAKEMDGGRVPETDAARAEAMDAAARAGQGVNAWFMMVFVGLAERFKRRTSDYGAGHEAVAAVLRRRAEEVEVLCADPKALVARMLASRSWRLWMAINKHARPQSSMAPTPTHPL